jgi:predicted O-methyltransferase YrrM
LSVANYLPSINNTSSIIWIMSSSIEAPANVLELLNRLHKQSLDQKTLIKDPNGQYQVIRESAKEKDENERNRIRDEAMKDKFIALDADKATFMYSLVRAIGALNVVEAGTSFGVSTIYLALAVAQNAEEAGKKPGEAKVIGTEHWHEKAEVARQYWKEAGNAVEPWIELREGDLRETLNKDLPTIDFVLFDSKNSAQFTRRTY